VGTGQRFACTSPKMSVMTAQTDQTYNGSQVLFRLAFARTRRARDFADQAARAGSTGEGDPVERRNRERDAVIEVIVLTQAALEAYVNWVYVQAGLDPTGGWIDRWQNLDQPAGQLGRPADFQLSSAQLDLLSEISALRNVLVHGDQRSRQRLVNSSVGASTVAEVLRGLTAGLAQTVVDNAEALFRWAGERTGITAPSSTGAWIASDE
jgi:hypothetical protein